jgi:hypothetical protein
VEEHAAEPADIGASIELGDLRLLGGHLVDGSDGHAGARQRGVRDGLLLAHPEVGQEGAFARAGVR